MSGAEFNALKFRNPSPLARRKAVHETGPGVLASLLLHLFAAVSVFWFLMQASHAPQSGQQIVPVDVVIRIADETRSPPAQSMAPIPQQRARQLEVKRTTAPRPLESTAPNKTRILPVDDLDAKLRGLARLHQPSTKLPMLDNATGAVDATSSGALAGDEATYSVRDFVRAQAERRWNLDFAKLGRRKFIIPIHIVMSQDGTILAAEVVDKQRFALDPVYRSTALSARNAILLSSPIALPAGTYNSSVEMTLDFNPRDMIR